ncbi:hypothetical protein GpartN1_g6647.t1 [Galdieria partita]|uniref:Uncharacterized protein n=1 Tax=Galdieria partita TaxID=83374 RepID=A0A9C7PRY6_9RHOD|nr:hypothetical protein GpartN1_g930.t1 [Galdieria partita]GJQ14856.1 hypothetical protein GpartN1_g6647.t1 [Galdieria partita]
MEWLGSVALMIGLWLLYLWFFGTTNTTFSKTSVAKFPTTHPITTEQSRLSMKESNRSVWRRVFSLLEDEVRQLHTRQQKLYACTEDWIHQAQSDFDRLRVVVNKLESKTTSKTNRVEDARKKKRLSLHPSMSLAFSIQDGTLRI